MRVFITWIAMLLVSVANGTVRDLGYAPHLHLSELAAHQISTVTELVLLWAVMAAHFHWHPPRSRSQAWGIGGVWMLMTVAFEFLFFHYVGHRPWSELLAAYDLSRGRLWALVPLWLLLGPVLFHRASVKSSDRSLFHSL